MYIDYTTLINPLELIWQFRPGESSSFLAPAELSGSHHGLQPKEKKKLEQASTLQHVSRRRGYIVPTKMEIRRALDD